MSLPAAPEPIDAVSSEPDGQAIRSSDANTRSGRKIINLIPAALLLVPIAVPAHPPQDTRRATSDGVAGDSPEKPDVVVTGRRAQGPSAHWRFTETGDYRSGFGDAASSRGWDICIEPGRFISALQKGLAAASPTRGKVDVPDECYRWKVTAVDGAIAATQQCFVGRVRITGSAQGTYDDDRVDIVKHRASLGPGLRVRGTYRVSGIRAGSCG